MFRKTGRFQRTDRILRKKDFERVIRSGKRSSSRSFVTFVVPSPESVRDPRRKLGITVSRRVGNSVVRNRVKRCIREWFRASREDLPEASELLVIARRPARDLVGSGFAQELDAMVAVRDEAKAC